MKLIIIIFLLLSLSSVATNTRLKAKKLSVSSTTKLQGSTILLVFKNILSISANIYQGFSLENRRKAEESHLERLEKITSFFAGSFAEMCSRASMSEILNNQIYQKFEFEVWRVELAGKQVLTAAMVDSTNPSLLPEEATLLNSSANSLWNQISSIKESMKPLIHASRAAVDSVCYFKQDLAVELKESSLRRIAQIKEEIGELNYFIKLLIKPSEYREKWFASIKKSVKNLKEPAESKTNLKGRLIAVTNLILSVFGINKELISSAIEAVRTIFSKISGKEDVSSVQLISNLIKVLKEIFLDFQTKAKIPKPFREATEGLLESTSVAEKDVLLGKTLAFIESISKESNGNSANLQKIKEKLEEIAKNSPEDHSKTDNSSSKAELEALVSTLSLPKDQLVILELLVNKITTSSRKAPEKHWKAFELSLSLVNLTMTKFKPSKTSKSLNFILELVELGLLIKNSTPQEAFKKVLLALGSKIKDMIFEKIKSDLKDALAKVIGKIVQPLIDIYNSISKIYVAHYQLANTRSNISQSERQLQNMLSKAKNINSIKVTALNFDSISNYKNLKEGTKLLFSFKRALSGKIEPNEHCAKSFLHCFSLIGANALNSLKRADKLYCPKDIFLEWTEDWEETLLSSGFEKSAKHNLYYNYFYSSTDLELLDLYFTEEKEEEAKKTWIHRRNVPHSDQIVQELVLKQFKIKDRKAYTISIKSEKLNYLPSLRQMFCKNFNIKFSKKPSLKRSSSFEIKDRNSSLLSQNYVQSELEHNLVREICSLVDRSLSSFTSNQFKAIIAKDKEMSRKYSVGNDKEKISVSEITDQIQIDKHFSLTRLDLALISRGKVPDIYNLKSFRGKKEFTFYEPENLSEGLFFSYINSKEPECLLAKELVTRNRIYTIDSKLSVNPDTGKASHKERNDFNLLKESEGIWKENSSKARQTKNVIEINKFVENQLLKIDRSNNLRYSDSKTKEDEKLKLSKCRYSIQFVSLNTGKKQPLKYELGYMKKMYVDSLNKTVYLPINVPIVKYKAIPEDSKERGFKPEIQFMITTEGPDITEKDREELRLAKNGALLKAANYGWVKLNSNKGHKFSISESFLLMFDKDLGEFKVDVLVRPLPLKSEEDPKQHCTNITKKVQLY